MRRALLVLLLPSLLGAAGISTRVESIDAANFPHIEATIHVFTPTPEVRLKPDDFQIGEDGKKVEKFSVAVDPRPIYLVLVLDQSGSMKDALPHLKRAAFEFADLLDERVRTKLVSFSDEVRTRTAFVQDSRLVKRRVTEIRAGGATRLYDAIDLATRSVGPFPHDVRRVVLVFTDGKDGKKGLEGRLSKKSAKEVARYAWAQGVPLYFLGLGKDLNKELLGKLASATGGQALFGSNPAGLRKIFEQMARSLEVSYRISYTSPNPKMDGSVRKLQILSRLKGETDQGKGRYKAPKLSKKASRTPEQVARGRGFAAYRKVLSTLRGLKGYQVVAESSVVGPPVEGGAAVEVANEVHVTHAPDGAEEVKVTTSLGRQGLGVRVLRSGDSAYVEVGHKFGKSLSGKVDLSKAAPGDAAAVKNPVRSVIGWLGGGAGDGEIKPPEDGSSFLFESPNRIRMVGADGKNAGVMSFSRKTFLPTHLVTVDVETGMSTQVHFRDWRTEGDFVVTVPDAVALAAGAEAFALRTAGAALKTAGAAMRTADAAVHVGMEGAAVGLEAAAAATETASAAVEVAAVATKVGLEGAAAGLEAAAAATELATAAARVGLEGAAAGLKVAGAAVRLAEPLTAAALRHTVRTLGGYSHMLGSPDFQQAVGAGVDAEYWTRFDGEGAEAAYTQSFSAGAQEFGEAMDVFAEDLDKELTKSAEEYEAAMEEYARNMEKMAAEMEAAAANVETAADAVDAAGKVLDVAGDAIDARGDAIDAAGDALDAAGDAIDAAVGAGQLNNLGKRLNDLGKQLNQLDDM